MTTPTATPSTVLMVDLTHQKPGSHSLQTDTDTDEEELIQSLATQTNA
jgi:hypothetical protein